MLSKTLSVILVVYFLFNFSYGQKDKKFFRKDYSYIESTEAFYKIHTSRKTWVDAKRTCAQEGASFFFPQDRIEANAVISFWKSTRAYIPWVFVGMSDIVSEGKFVTVDGKSDSEVYNQWQPNEPNDRDGNEDCVHLNLSGDLNDYRCDGPSYFICKKSLQTVQWDYNCNMSNTDYTFNEGIGKCYKLHTVPMDWAQASAECNAEQSYLAVISNAVEADYLASLTETTFKQRAEGNYFRGIYHVGFHNAFLDGWQTVKGTPINAESDIWWNKNQPDKDDSERRCGSMFYTGLLNTIDCDTKSFFICEHEVDDIKSNLGDSVY